MKIDIFGLEKIKFKTSTDAKNALAQINALAKEKGYATLYDIQKMCGLAILDDEEDALKSYGYTKSMIYDMTVQFNTEDWKYYIVSKKYVELKSSLDDKKVILDIKIVEGGSLIKSYMLYATTSDGKEHACKINGKLAVKILNDILENSTEVF